MAVPRTPLTREQHPPALPPTEVNVPVRAEAALLARTVLPEIPVMPADAPSEDSDWPARLPRTAAQTASAAQAQAASARTRARRRFLGGTLSVLIVAGVFGLALPRISSYGQEWHSVAAMTWPGILLVSSAAAGSLAATWVMIRAFLPQLRMHQAAAVSLGSSAVANTVPAGGAVALGLTWRMLASWGIGTQDFVRYTLVSGLWNVFARLSLPVIALLALAVSGKSGGIPPAAAYSGAGALFVVAAGLRFLLRSKNCATLAGRVLQRMETLGCRLARRRPSRRLADGLLSFRADTSAMLAERGIRITVTAVLANIAFWLVLLACLRASGLTQGQVSWQASLAAFAAVRLVTVLPLTPGGLGIVELGLTAPLIGGLGSGASARVAAAVLLYRALTYLPSLPLGALAYAWWRHSSRGAAVGPSR
ncbi:MAG TPA: YbhN family protein [Streptosporangiaceae bacterium]|nr:YbhN family protein [Streptosporangiaceae bacterium]